jgi:uncharacterized protein (DUF4415 family)
MTPNDDDDTPEFTDDVMNRARPAVEVLPPEVIAAFRNRGGRPRVEAAKVPVSLRLDPDVLAAFKAINEALRRAAGSLNRLPGQV